ncbi:MAG: ABC transporter permease [Pleurocapsa sp. SU_196_0]|nr:ABC transporter permease [Pleurocapsa sp. SU_196_0]
MFAYSVWTNRLESSCSGATVTDGDIFTRIWFGAQISLTIGIFAVFLSQILAFTFGGLAGYYGGWVDNTIMRFVEILGAIPGLILLITLTSILPQNLDPILVFYGIVFFLGLIGWGGGARTIRSQILALKEVDYVQAANALGAREARIIGVHMLPTTFSLVIVGLSLAIPGFILTEAVLSFIGRGIREPYSSWGLMLNNAQEGGGHMRLIIGYNTKTGQLLFSDSWGAGHELKRIKLEDGVRLHEKVKVELDDLRPRHRLAAGQAVPVGDRS